MGRIRAFLGINFPVPLVRRLGDEVRAIQPQVQAAGLQVAWVPQANMHLTLKFLGAIPAESVEAIQGRLGRELGGRTGFELDVRGLGAFPDARRPRVVWAGVKPHPALAALQEQVEVWMEELGYPREERAFHPHVTIGRVKGGQGSLEPLIASRENIFYGSGRVNEVVVYESKTLRAGAEYTALARLAIGVPPGSKERERSESSEEPVLNDEQ